VFCVVGDVCENKSMVMKVGLGYYGEWVLRGDIV
jgi:hypothetical protein